MAPSQLPARQPALTKASDADRHPVAPPQPAATPATPVPEQPERLEPGPAPLVMFSVRLPRDLRTELKVTALRAGLTVEKWTEAILAAAVHAANDRNSGSSLG